MVCSNNANSVVHDNIKILYMYILEQKRTVNIKTELSGFVHVGFQKLLPEGG